MAMSYQRRINQALISAAWEGRLDAIPVLIELGADVNYREDYTESCPAIRSDDTEEYKEDNFRHNSCLRKGWHRGYTPLISATFISRRDCIELLLNEGADVNDVGVTGYPPLSRVSGHPGCIELLLEAGADVNNGDAFDATGIDRSVRKGSIDSVRLLVNAGTNPEDGIASAAKFGYSEILSLLIEAGADVNGNYREDREDTLLMLATGTGVAGEPKGDPSPECVKILLQAGAYVNVFDTSRLCALWKAAIESAVRFDGHSSDGEQIMLKLIEEILMLLYVAGQKIFGIIPEQLKESGLSLKHLSREAVRKQLTDVSTVNLFHSVPKLVLPRVIKSYLLYDIDLDRYTSQSEEFIESIRCKYRCLFSADNEDSSQVH